MPHLLQVSKQKIPTTLKSNLSDIILHVSDPNQLANDLYAENMIARSVRDRVVENLVSPKYDKAATLMNELERSYFLDSDDENIVNKFRKLCIALNRQGNPDLSDLVEKMKLSIEKNDV